MKMSASVAKTSGKCVTAGGGVLKKNHMKPENELLIFDPKISD